MTIMGFNKIDFLRDLIDDVASSERAGKKFEADAAILGPLLVGVQRELTGERERIARAHGRLRFLPLFVRRWVLGFS
jgi:hypothetical protein